ncbi:MAG: hypothetical protein IKL71_06525 [Bacteroidaceae bacterium]|nr:hypothetical protein [Bacteroidaceae bacterium]
MEDNFNLQPVIDYVSKDWQLGPVHGIGHWKRVERNGLLLATEEVNVKVVRLFAYLHDHKRLDDGWDMEHGQRAAENLDNIRQTLLAGLTDEEFGMLRRACMEHSITQRTGIPTIDACFDADRLDLPRVGYRPDPARMASELGALYAKYDVVADDCSISEEKMKMAKVR